MRRLGLLTLLTLLGCPSGSSRLRGRGDDAPASASVREVVITDAAVDAAVDHSIVDAAVDESDARLAADVPGMRVVPGGTFEMGMNDGGEGDERPSHEVTLRSFFLDVTEVTRGAYEECVHASRCPAPDDRVLIRAGAPAVEFTRPKQPVVGVTWEDARVYCAYAGNRLPREAEFERAVRGSDGRRYPWGNEPPTSDRTVFQRQLKRESFDDVGTHPSGRGPYGHDDLAGNVWEWMADDYDPYAYRRSTANQGIPGTCAQILETQDELRLNGSEGFTGSNPIPRICEKVLRGGAFNYDAWGLRSTNRVHHPPNFHLVMAGFRCARDLSP